MITRHLCASTAVALALSVFVVPSICLAQANATNVPTEAAPPPTPPAPTPPVAPTAATPTPPAAPDTGTAASGERPSTYTLEKGDTLDKIAKQFGTTGRKLQKYNHFTNAQVRRLQIGQVIKIPPAPADSTSK
jgi:LysM repeat protein